MKTIFFSLYKEKTIEKQPDKLKKLTTSINEIHSHPHVFHFTLYHIPLSWRKFSTVIPISLFRIFPLQMRELRLKFHSPTVPYHGIYFNVMLWVWNKRSEKPEMWLFWTANFILTWIKKLWKPTVSLRREHASPMLCSRIQLLIWGLQNSLTVRIWY